MQLEDWRECPPSRLAPLLAGQCERWRSELGWDAQPLFDLIEQARAAGQLPGFVAVDLRGHVSGWCYANVHDGLMFIGALHGRRADVVRALLDGLLATPEAAYARGYRCFLFPDSATVAAALARRRFDIQPFLYLSRPLAILPVSDPPPDVRPWGLDDVPETARLLARAYAGTPSSRCFAPGGRLEEWAAYVGQLARTPACGEWAPAASLATTTDAPAGTLSAILLATSLSADTIHVAQVAVDPRVQRRGLAAALINTSAGRAGAAGARRQTLLVAESNAAARALYARLGFTQRTTFLFAERPRLSRVTSAADATRASA